MASLAVAAVAVLLVATPPSAFAADKKNSDQTVRSVQGTVTDDTFFVQLSPGAFFYLSLEGGGGQDTLNVQGSGINDTVTLTPTGTSLQSAVAPFSFQVGLSAQFTHFATQLF